MRCALWKIHKTLIKGDGDREDKMVYVQIMEKCSLNTLSLSLYIVSKWLKNVVQPERLGFMRLNWHVDGSSFNALNFSLRLSDRVARLKSHPHVNLMTYTWMLLVQVLARYIHINLFRQRSALWKVQRAWRKFSSRFPTPTNRREQCFNDISFSEFFKRLYTTFYVHYVINIQSFFAMCIFVFFLFNIFVCELKYIITYNW